MLQYGDAEMMAMTATLYIWIIVWFIINVLLLIWVYKDAKSRNMNAIGWVIIVFCCGCCGCIIYLLVRQPKS